MELGLMKIFDQFSLAVTNLIFDFDSRNQTAVMQARTGIDTILSFHA